MSYARVDKPFVRGLFEELAKREGNEIWVDWDDLRAFDPSWRSTLYVAIEACDIFVFIMSPGSVNSGVCAQEAAHAAQHGKRLAVIVYQTVPDEIWRERLPWIEEPQWFYFDGTKGFEFTVDRLLEALSLDHDYIRAHTRLYVRAREWEEVGDASLLLHGADLRNAETWLQQAGDRHPAPTLLHRRYIRESRESAVRHLEIRLIDGAELAASDLDPTLSVLLATEAYRISRSPRAEQILRRGLKLPSLFCSVHEDQPGRPYRRDKHLAERLLCRCVHGPVRQGIRDTVGT